MIAGDTITVLLVDDDIVLRESIAAYLTDSDYEVLEAENGEVGLDMFRREQPDIVLLDLRMPVMDGMELLSILVQEAEDIPVIIVSGMGTMDDSIQALHLGAWDYITKPIHDFELLNHTLEKVMERARLIRENRQYQEHLEKEVVSRTADLARVNQALRTLSRCNEALIHAEDEEGFLGDLCEVITEVGGYSGVWIGSNEPEKQGLVVCHVASRGVDNALVNNCVGTNLNGEREKMTPVQRAALGETVVVQDVLSSPGCTCFRDGMNKQGIRSVAALPLQLEKRSFGVLVIYSDKANAYGTEEISLLTELAGDLGFGISMLRMRIERRNAINEQVKSARTLHHSLVKTVQAIAMTLEKRDPYTAGHQQTQYPECS